MLFKTVSARVVAACLAASLPLAAHAAENEDDPAKIQAEAAANAVAEAWASPPLDEETKQYEGKVSVDGRSINYTATAGTLTIRNDQGKPSASLFYTAYTAEGEDRPVTFFYNGGPGSASLWLRMGSFAPETVMTDDPITSEPAPFATIGPNPDTLIGTTDMVFIDAPGAGYSRIVSGSEGAEFYGVDQDIDAFARAIKRYVTTNKRWNDPKYIFGESYGTTRSGGLARVLEEDGVQMNGVILLSTILNYGIDQSGYDDAYISFLPTYAATAWYHDRVAEKPADLASFVEEARQFANGPYRLALAKGQDISDAEQDQIAERLNYFTGLSTEYLKQTNLRIESARFRKELLREQGKTVGRFDGRYVGYDTDSAGEWPGYDASSTGITGNYVSGFMERLTNKFGYETDLRYRLSARPYSGEEGWSWDISHNAPGEMWKQPVVDVTVDLSRAMRINPHLKVLSLNGYYDMATPFFATELDLSHMLLPKPFRDNLTYRYYKAGHMIYLNPEERHQMRLDLEAFYDQSHG